MKKNIKTALGESLKAEERAVRNRFEKADAAFERGSARVSIAAPPPERVVRDSFTMPAEDYALITELKKRALKAGVSANKSELLRAGLLALERLNQSELAAQLARLARVKTGRPAAPARRNEP